jgi:hypothetical protein
MTELYRGLLYILTTRFNGVLDTFRTHIRSFNPQTSDPENYLDVGVFGFWNLVLEIIFTLFSIACLTAGILLLITLALFAYPFEAALTFSSKIVGYTRNPPPDFFDEPAEDQPVIVKRNDKEKK